MKKRMAIIGKEFVLANILCTAMDKGIPSINRVTTEAKPRHTAIGIEVNNKTTKTTKVIIVRPLFFKNYEK
jgi:hypothetical protein